MNLGVSRQKRGREMTACWKSDICIVHIYGIIRLCVMVISREHVVLVTKGVTVHGVNGGTPRKKVSYVQPAPCGVSELLLGCF